MTKRLIPCVAFALTLAVWQTPARVHAGPPVHRETGKEAKALPEEPRYQLQPIFTRLGTISDKFTFSTTFRGSRGVDLQEAQNLESWGIDAEVVFPFLKRFQLRVAVPVYTEGQARLLPVSVTHHRTGRITRQPTHRVYMSGYGGVFDYASLQLEAQFLTQEQNGLNMIASIGASKIADPLRTDSVGRYNHAGESYMGQIRADRKMNDWLTLVGHLGFRHYYISDDLNPAGNADGDVFTHFEAFAAGVFNPWNSNVFPVLEVAFTGDLDQYNSVLVVPEVIWAVNQHLELKAGFPLGLSNDGERVGFRVQGVLRF